MCSAYIKKEPKKIKKRKMESCNSGNMQSSSGGEEEYDSRATFMSGGVPINPNSLPPLTPFFDPIVSIYLPLNSFSSHTKTINNDPLITNDNLNNNSTNYAPTNNHHPFPTTIQPPAARNPKKRSRASRRAPTTVLTTDTTNFRAMVQEFTGIPPPPFVNSSPFARNGLDLFASSLDAPPSYLRRPFAQKLQSPVFPFLAGNNSITNNPVNGNTTSSTGTLQSSNVISNFDQSFLLGSKVAADHQHFGLSTVTTTFGGELANLISLSTNNNVPNPQDIVRTGHENGMRSNGKRFDYSGPSSVSNFDGEKRPENSGREGMVETWICSSSD